MGGGLSSARITSVNATTPIKVNTLTKQTGIVYDICLDESSEIAKQRKAGSAYIGAIRFRDKSSTSTDASKLAIAHPSDKNFINIPLKNEIVEIHEIGTGEYTYSRIGTESNPSISAN